MIDRFRGEYRRLAVLGPLLLLGCGGPEPVPDATQKDSGAGSAPAAAPAPAPVVPTILFIGTSLTAGLGLDPEQAYPARVQARIDSAGLNYRAVNAGVSGETSAGALRRIEWLLGQGAPAAVVIETGANDGLRGQSIDSLRANIEGILDMIDRLEPRPIVFLAAMEALPNLGADYVRRFRAIYPEIAARRDAILIPFFLDGVAGVDSLNQPDGIHPNAAGAERAAARMWKAIAPELTANGERRTAN